MESGSRINEQVLLALHFQHSILDKLLSDIVGYKLAPTKGPLLKVKMQLWRNQQLQFLLKSLLRHSTNQM